LVVDDHGIVREGLIALLAAQDGIRVLGSAASGLEAVQAAERLKPDIVIMDLVLPDMNGIDATHRIVRILPLTRVIILSASHNIENVYRALRSGACGYVVKDARGDELMDAVRAVRSGKQFLSPKVTPPAVDGAGCYSLPKSPLERLSLRERDVLHRLRPNDRVVFLCHSKGGLDALVALSTSGDLRSRVAAIVSRRPFFA